MRHQYSPSSRITHSLIFVNSHIWERRQRYLFLAAASRLPRERLLLPLLRLLVKIRLLLLLLLSYTFDVDVWHDHHLGQVRVERLSQYYRVSSVALLRWALRVGVIVSWKVTPKFYGIPILPGSGIGLHKFRNIMMIVLIDIRIIVNLVH